MNLNDRFLAYHTYKGVRRLIYELKPATLPSGDHFIVTKVFGDTWPGFVNHYFSGDYDKIAWKLIRLENPNDVVKEMIYENSR